MSKSELMVRIKFLDTMYMVSDSVSKVLRDIVFRRGLSSMAMGGILKSGVTQLSKKVSLNHPNNVH